MAMNIMYCVDVPLHAASGLFMFTLPPKRGTTRKHKLIKKGEYRLATTKQVTRINNQYHLADAA